MQKSGFLGILGLIGVGAFGQSISTVGAGYVSPAPLTVAPGQVVTLFVNGIGGLTQIFQAPGKRWPTTLGGVSVTLEQGANIPVPIFEVRPVSTCSVPPVGSPNPCGTLVALTVQIPFELIPICPLCGRPTILTHLLVNANNQNATLIDLLPLADQVHILSSCDILVSGGGNRSNATALPCPPMVTHAGGSRVSAFNPAKGGEELVAYAVGLGPTNPPGVTGQANGSAAPTITIFGLDFNFRPNALPAKPTPLLTPRGAPISLFPTPIFAGLTPSFVGLYQVNFVVPAIPAGTPACVDPSQTALGGTFVQSNLTVSVGSAFSFDGAGICVTPAS